MSDKTQALLELYWLIRNVRWRYQLDRYEDAAIAGMLGIVTASMDDIWGQVAAKRISLDRADALIAELETLSVGLRAQMGEQVSAMASEVAVRSAVVHADILSAGGSIPGIETVALSANQFRQFVAGPVGGGVSLPEWVDAAWGRAVSDQIRTSLASGALQGQSYPKIVRGLLNQGLVDLKAEAITIARTYVQTASVAAQMATYQANAGIMNGWIWSAVLEPGYMGTGRGTCIRCSALDGQKFKLGEGPDIPLHPRCRCIARPWTKSWQELGAKEGEVLERIRPHTMRPEENVDAGGKRTIFEVGRHEGDYASWFEKQSRAFKLNAVGPGRLSLLESGKIRFVDLVDAKGRTRTLEELTQS